MRRLVQSVIASGYMYMYNLRIHVFIQGTCKQAPTWWLEIRSPPSRKVLFMTKIRKVRTRRPAMSRWNDHREFRLLTHAEKSNRTHPLHPHLLKMAIGSFAP